MNKSIFAIAVLSVACTDVKSSSINTDGMYLNYSVVTEGEGTGTTADVVLRVGGITSTTYVDLEEGDRLLVDVEDESEVLQKQSLGVMHSYSGTFQADAVDSEFVLNFERVNLNSAPSSVASLPAAFSLTAPEEDTSISRSDETAELVVTWDGEGSDSMSIEVSGDCFEMYSEANIPDSGSYSIPASYFADHAFDAVSACEASVVVERRRTGTLDAQFGEGMVYGAQRRTASVRIDP